MHVEPLSHALDGAPLVTGAGGVVREKLVELPGPQLSPDVVRFISAFERHVGAIGRQLLFGERDADVEVALDEIVMSGDLDRAVEEMLPGLLQTLVTIDSKSPGKITISGHLPESVRPLVADAVLYGAWVVVATVRAEQVGAPSVDALVRARSVGGGPLAPMHALPPTIAELWWKGARGATASFAIFYIAASRSWPAGDAAMKRIHRLAEIWREGAWSSLRVAASRPGSGVPADIVPGGDRLDLERIGREYDASLRELDRLAEQAPVGVYPGISDEFE